MGQVAPHQDSKFFPVHEGFEKIWPVGFVNAFA